MNWRARKDESDVTWKPMSSAETGGDGGLAAMIWGRVGK